MVMRRVDNDGFVTLIRRGGFDEKPILLLYFEDETVDAKDAMRRMIRPPTGFIAFVERIKIWLG